MAYVYSSRLRVKTNGMVERFNRRIAELVSQTRFSLIAELSEIMSQYLQIYNNCIPQRALEHKSPERFKKRVYKQAGLDG